MTRLLFAILLLTASSLHAQKIEEFFDISFKPTKGFPRYYVTTEPKRDHWYREAYYLPEKTLALKAWYKDKECTIPDGEEIFFYPHKNMQSKGNYANGKKEGIWLRFHENGMLHDSSFYSNGHLSAVSIGWDDDGYQVDSSFFDGKGNGVKVHWYTNGAIYSAGFISADTNKIKRWNYYHLNGNVMATEEYDSAGKRISCECFTDAGQRLDSCTEQEASYPGGDKAWRTHIERRVNPMVPVNKKAPVGSYHIMISFVVDTNGKINDIIPLTKFGYGMEEEVIRAVKTFPPWIPAYQFGKKVKAYRKQSVTFTVSR
ncbi:MAG: hypothetical protein WDN26_10175 [Chitinophagaceae bacterium]